MRALTLSLAIAALVSACGKPRAAPTRPVDCPSWTAEVAALVAERCVGCHGADAPAGGYDVRDYLGVLGVGSDGVANAIAGDAASKLLVVLAPADATHAALVDTRASLETWVVDCRLAYVDSPLHAGGLMNPADGDFHGQLLRDEGWDFALCQGCHGDPARPDDWAGGTSGKPCTPCHTDGPTGCATCHGEVPASGAHAAHVVAGPLERPTGCDACHVVPARWDAPGHILTAAGAVDDAPAEVVLGALAARDLEPPRREGPPAYDAATGRCDNVYCHGGVFADTRATFAAPTWRAPDQGGAGQAACGGCHGTAPSDHAAPESSCTTCHPTVVDASGALLTARHLDGTVQLGDESGRCSACHGSGDDPAPPHDLQGATVASALGVGAHRAHLRASKLRGPIACVECHRVPETVLGAGHLDSDLPAEVFPEGVAGTGTLARADGAAPVWTRASATCTGVYCHGGGAALAADVAPGLHRAPVWTRLDFGEAACGTCHGVPPVDGVHALDLTLTDCHDCHAGSVDASGSILITGPPGAESSEHIDGNVDL